MNALRTDELQPGDVVVYDLEQPKTIRVIDRLDADGLRIWITWQGDHPDDHIRTSRLWTLTSDQPTRRSATP